MKSFIVDWQRPNENVPMEIVTNHFKLDPLIIYTKDGLNFEMDVRMIMQIDDDSIIVKNFGSLPIFIENTFNTLIKNFFSFKEKGYIVSNRLNLQEELIEKLQKELTNYSMTINKFMIVYMLKVCEYKIKKKTGN